MTGWWVKSIYMHTRDDRQVGQVYLHAGLLGVTGQWVKSIYTPTRGERQVGQVCLDAFIYNIRKMVMGKIPQYFYIKNTYLHGSSKMNTVLKIWNFSPLYY